jgi:hypothetical protein
VAQEVFVVDFGSVLPRQFPGAVSEEQFVDATFEALLPRGFNAENTIACVGVCRDELCQPITTLARERWGEAFNFSALAGMLLLGRTGFEAAQAHGAMEDGRQRYVYIVMPHVGLGESGTVGECKRTGLPGIAHACGALCKLQAEFESGRLEFDLDPDDPELSLIRRRLAERLQWGQVPTLLELTELAEQVIVDDLERMIDLTVDRERADYAVLSGIQINGSDQQNYVRPGKMYAVIRGIRVDLTLKVASA